MWAASKAAVIGYVHLQNDWGKGSSRWEREKHRKIIIIKKGNRERKREKG